MTDEFSHPLKAHVGRLVTSVGAAFPGERAVFRGHDLHHDLMKSLGWFGLCVFGITGRQFSPGQLRVLEHNFVVTSYPDARIWNNRVVALGATARSTPTLSLAAGNAVSEARIYGRGNEYRAVAFFKRVHDDLAQGVPLDESLKRYQATQGNFPGYGRPLASRDERIEPTMAEARLHGLDQGPHVKLAFKIERHLLSQGRPLQMNQGALVSAYAADFGFTPLEFNLMYHCVFLCGMQPCYVEGLSKPAGAVFPTQISDVAYEGPPARRWPESYTD